jgi:predicted nucleic acid-binding Zn finger protein
LLVHGRWFSPGFPAASATKTGRHDIAEILLKMALKHQKSNQINYEKNSQRSILRRVGSLRHNDNIQRKLIINV